MKEAEERAHQKDLEKQQKALDKPSRRSKKKMHPPGEQEGKSSATPSPAFDSGSQAPTISRGTKRDSSYEQLTQIPVLTVTKDDESRNDELIINSSLEAVLRGDSDEFSPLYLDLKDFMLKVLVNLISAWH